MKCNIEKRSRWQDKHLLVLNSSYQNRHIIFPASLPIKKMDYLNSLPNLAKEIKLLLTSTFIREFAKDRSLWPYNSEFK